MAIEAPRIRPGSHVRLHLEVHLDDGTEVLSSFDDDAMELDVGDGTLAPGLEDLLVGLEGGADERFTADGSSLFGPRDESKVHWLSRTHFPLELDLARGQVVAFEAPEGQEVAGLLVEIDDERVLVDFNHPLCGHTLEIRACIVSVDDPGNASSAALYQ